MSDTMKNVVFCGKLTLFALFTEQPVCCPDLFMVLFWNANVSMGFSLLPFIILKELNSLLQIALGTFCLTITGTAYKWSPSGCNQCKVLTAGDSHAKTDP